MPREFSYELDSLEKVTAARDALASCPADKGDISLCKELTDVINNPTKYNALSQPRIHKWLKKAFGL